MGNGAERQPRGTGTALSDRFFRHAPGRPEGRPTNATRYLCAAAYLNPAYANQVIWELVASRRAVAPSVGMDLGPVIRHCLNARRIQLTRDVILAILLVAGLIVATVPTLIVLFIGFLLSLLPAPDGQRHSLTFKLLAGTGIAIAVVGVIVVITLWLALGALGRLVGSGAPSVNAAGADVLVIVLGLAFLILSGATVYVYTYTRYRILGERLRPDAGPFSFDASTARIESRITEVEAAQWGNVALYAGGNPFLGTGRRNRAWSIAIELDRARPARQDNWAQPNSRGSVAIDPVELQAVIRERLLKLKDPGLPDNERISALTVEDHIVGEGQRRWDGPLVDPVRNVPYSEASPEAINALIRHPQAGLRYYQRVCVNDEGQAVLSDGQQVIGRADQEIAVSAFVYVAVEGRMFYLEFISTALPPVQYRYHIINLLARMSHSKFLMLVIGDAARAYLSYVISSPFRIFGTLRLMHRERKLADEEVTSITDYLQDNVGARISVRELGASSAMHTYIQELDETKYTKIIERLLTDTVLDFLVSKGVDTSAYRASVSVAINNGTVIAGETISNVNLGGSGSTFNMTQQQADSATATE